MNVRGLTVDRVHFAVILLCLFCGVKYCIAGRPGRILCNFLRRGAMCVYHTRTHYAKKDIPYGSESDRHSASAHTTGPIRASRCHPARGGFSAQQRGESSIQLVCCIYHVRLRTRLIYIYIPGILFCCSLFVSLDYSFRTCVAKYRLSHSKKILNRCL